MATIETAVSNPRHVPSLDAVFRRANLRDIPYHALYEERS
jgi:hypothetical protein